MRGRQYDHNPASVLEDKESTWELIPEGPVRVAWHLRPGGAFICNDVEAKLWKAHEGKSHYDCISHATPVVWVKYDRAARLTEWEKRRARGYRPPRKRPQTHSSYLSTATQSSENGSFVIGSPSDKPTSSPDSRSDVKGPVEEKEC